MVKKLFSIIFICVSIIGCDNQIIGVEDNNSNSGYFLVVNSYLDMDDNGYYTIEFLDDYNQTFTTLSAETGSDNVYQKMAWKSNKEINIGGYWINLVNGNSYTDNLGEAHTVLSVWPEFIGDTIKVYAGYTDEYNNHYVDSLEVIVKNLE
jgi:hypothetical protein